MVGLLDQLVDVGGELLAGVAKFFEVVVHATHPVWRLVNAEHRSP
jgi:hypothetical protein